MTVTYFHYWDDVKNYIQNKHLAQKIHAITIINKGSVISAGRTGEPIPSDLPERYTKYNREIWQLVKDICDMRGRTPDFAVIDNYISETPNYPTNGCASSTEYLKKLKIKILKEATNLMDMINTEESKASYNRVSEQLE